MTQTWWIERERQDATSENRAGEDVAREITRLESAFGRLGAPELAAIESIVAAARVVEDQALIGRSLCLWSRSLIGRGLHEAAVVSSREGLVAFNALDERRAQAHLCSHAEMLRTAGNALLKLGRSGAALPLLEDAVAKADAAVQSASSPEEASGSVYTLVRCLNNLGVALFAVRELDAAIEVYRRTTVVAASAQADNRGIDDVVLAECNLIVAVHERVRRSRAAAEQDRVDADLRWAEALIGSAAIRVADAANDGDRLSGYGRQAFFGACGQNLLMTQRPEQAIAMFERQMAQVADEDGPMYVWVQAMANAGLAEATLALGRPHDALRHSVEALDHFKSHDEAHERAPVLLARAAALRMLGEFDAAYAELEAYHGLRARLEAAAAQEYAGYVAAKFGLERARVEIEAHRRIAATLETLTRIGQEITTSLEADTVLRILHRHVGESMDARAFAVWLFDETRSALDLAFEVPGDGIAPAPPTIGLDDEHSSAGRSVRELRQIVDTPADTLRNAQPSSSRSRLSAPLIVGARVIGVLSIQSERLDAYGENERSIVHTLCTYAAIALDNAATCHKLESTVSTLLITQTELAARTAEYEHLSMTDVLTGVPNRRHFTERATIEIAAARRNGTDLGVAMFDIDHFKKVNDTYGHFAGDRVLQIIAEVAKKAMRPVDLLARVGGEEFALLLPGAEPLKVLDIAERLREAVENTAVRVDEFELHVTASFGVANFRLAGDTFDDAFRRADGALYRAKEDGRNRVRSAP